MSSVEYIALRQLDWFSEARDEELEDPHFWCLAQQSIYEDIYRTMSQRVCYMHVLDRTHLRKNSEYFGDALGIMKRLGLFQLMDIQCHTMRRLFSSSTLLLLLRRMRLSPCRGNLETVAMGRLIGGARRW
jgi:hypothetical protein